MAGRDDLDDLMTETDFELEAQFQALEQRANLNTIEARMAAEERAAREQGAAPGWGDAEIVEIGDGPPATKAPPTSPAAPLPGDDPLADLKAAFIAGARPAAPAPKTAQLTEVLVVLCPACGRKNRLPRLQLAAAATPLCGACHTSLVTLR